MGRWIKRIVLAVLLLVLVLPLGFRGAAALRETMTVAQAMPAEGRLVSTSMGQVYIEETGPKDGVPVLLVHGSVGWARLWSETSQALAAAGFRAIAFDLAPMGFSDRDTIGDYGRVRQAERILALIEALGIRPMLAAHSFGAGPGVEAVMRHPAGFAGLIIIDGAVGMHGHDMVKPMPWPLRSQWVRELVIATTVTNPLVTKRLLALFLYRKDRANDQYAGILRQPAVLRGTTAELAHWLPSLLVPPTDAHSTRPEFYRALDLPTAILWGREDTTTPLAQGQELAGLVPGAELVVLDGVGHIPQIEDPGAFNTALIAALEKLVDPGR